MGLVAKLTQERRARLAAERLLEQKQAELFAANRQLGKHARALSEEIVETRERVRSIEDENARVRDELSSANDRIQLVERRLWQSIETIPDGFALFDEDGRLVMANRAYLLPFDGLTAVGPGVSYMEMLQFCTEEGIVDIGDMAPAAWREYMRERWQSDAPGPRIVRLWNGRAIRLLDQRAPSGDMVSLALDITAEVRSKEVLRRAKHRAEAASRAKSAFLANMSHEIRTPMNGVMGMADLLRETDLDEDQALYATTIRNSAEALLGIINDVLDYSKVEADRLSLQLDGFDLERCLHEIILLMQPKARDQGVDVWLDYDLFLPTRLRGDGGRLRQVLTNLIGNAVKFTPEGHVLIRVVGVSAEGRAEIHVTVEDTGIGIAPDKIGHVFGEFNQVEEAQNRRFEGTGLGLAIAQKLIRLMGGEIWVESAPGQGSVFGFTITLDIEEPQGQEPCRLPERLRQVVVAGRPEGARMILERQLAQLGLAVQSCHGAEALADALGAGGDLVIVIHEGEAWTDRALRKLPPDLPVIVMAASRGAWTGSRGQLLQMPVARHELCAALGRVGQAVGQVEPEKTVPERVESPPKSEPVSPQLRKLRVLAAEDNRTNRLVFEKMVKALAIELRFAENGREAVAGYAAFEPDIIFMDISMPEMDGKEASRAIRRHEGHGAHVPIVAMTAHAMQGDEADIRAAGIDHYLTKPLRKPELIARMAAAVGPGIAPIEPEAAISPDG